MKNLNSMMMAAMAVFALAAAAACEKDTIGNKIDDATDSRPAEKLQDGAEDVKDAVKDATN